MNQAIYSWLVRPLSSLSKDFSKNFLEEEFLNLTEKNYVSIVISRYFLAINFLLYSCGLFLRFYFKLNKLHCLNLYLYLSHSISIEKNQIYFLVCFCSKYLILIIVMKFIKFSLIQLFTSRNTFTLFEKPWYNPCIRMPQNNCIKNIEKFEVYFKFKIKISLLKL